MWNVQSTNLAHLRIFKYFELLHQLILESDVGIYKSALLFTSDQNISHDSSITELDDILFCKQYREMGLVTDSQDILSNVYIFFKSSESLAELTPKQLSKGKSRLHTYRLGHTAAFKAAQACFNYRNFESCYRIVQLLTWQLYLSGNTSEIESWSELSVLGASCLQQLLQSILNSASIDHKYALGCILSLPTDKAFASFKDGLALTSTQYERLRNVAEVGAVAGSVWSQRTFQVHCQTLANSARWWQEFRLLDIPFNETQFQETGTNYHASLIPMIIFKTKGDLMAAYEYTDAYHIQYDVALFEYIKQQFLTFVSKGASDYDSRHSLIITAIADCTNKALLVKMLLTQCEPNLSPYDYEGSLDLFRACISA